MGLEIQRSSYRWYTSVPFYRIYTLFGCIGYSVFLFILFPLSRLNRPRLNSIRVIHYGIGVLENAVVDLTNSRVLTRRLDMTLNYRWKRRMEYLYLISDIYQFNFSDRNNWIWSFSKMVFFFRFTCIGISSSRVIYFQGWASISFRHLWNAGGFRVLGF